MLLQQVFAHSPHLAAPAGPALRLLLLTLPFLLFFLSSFVSKIKASLKGCCVSVHCGSWTNLRFGGRTGALPLCCLQQ